MKTIMIGDSILSLENVRRVDREISHNKRESHKIRISYCDGATEWAVIDYNDKEDLDTFFYAIRNILTED